MLFVLQPFADSAPRIALGGLAEASHSDLWQAYNALAVHQDQTERALTEFRAWLDEAVENAAVDSLDSAFDIEAAYRYVQAELDRRFGRTP